MPTEVEVRIRVWKEPGDERIHLQLADSELAEQTFFVDSRRNYSGGNPRLFKALEKLLLQLDKGTR